MDDIASYADSELAYRDEPAIDTLHRMRHLRFFLCELPYEESRRVTDRQWHELKYQLEDAERRI